MYIKNSTVTVNFVIPVSASPLVQADYDIKVITPSGDVTYTESALLTYVAPTATAQGSATYDHLVDEIGMWKFELANGPIASPTLLSEASIFVIVPITTPVVSTINKTVNLTLPVLPPPIAPDTLAAVPVSDTAIDLTWADNSDNELNFVLERSLTTGTGFAVIGYPVANAVAYSDSGLTADTTYFYRIKATNAAGDSAYSSEASATTSAQFGNLTVVGFTAQGVDFTWQDVNTAPIWEYATDGIISIPSIPLSVDFAGSEYLSGGTDFSFRFQPTQFAQDWGASHQNPLIPDTYYIRLLRTIAGTSDTWFQDQGVQLGDSAEYILP